MGTEDPFHNWTFSEISILLKSTSIYSTKLKKQEQLKTVLPATQILTTKEGNQINNVSPYNELYDGSF